MTEHDRAARRRLVWLLLTRGDLGAETLRSDGMPALGPGLALEADRPSIVSEDPPEADAA
ncbi:MAG: hypothetical protein V7607_6589 [Solirubrobacteraceae bacterium]